MNKSEILAFLNANPSCHLATVEGNKPHARGMGMYKADENGIIFQTWYRKDLHKQLSENPNVELCFNNFKEGFQIRVSGTMELVEDMELKKEIMAKRKRLKPFLEQVGYEGVAIYNLKKGVATVWSFETNFAPKTYIKL